jgi:FGGY-family pentulose kinase
MTPNSLFLGVDVGTGSARAGIFTAEGKLLGSSSHPIQMWKPQPEFAEQSSEDIWAACCKAVRGAIAKAGVSAQAITGIGFDATCSLVALDKEQQPVTISPTGRAEQNVIVWMDHRAVSQADRINATHHEVLRNTGGVISPEMQTPKLLWLKENLAENLERAAYFFDLPDFLTFRATGDATRSLCSTVCKWTYRSDRADEGMGWDRGFFETVGLGDLAEEGYRRIGTRVRPMGEAIANGLSERAACELGLRPRTRVGVSIIDAHAGGLGMLGASLDGAKADRELWEHRMALIGGTSSCHMAVSSAPRFIPGVWGPYYSAMIPELWLTEGGQSATGALIDHVISTHSAAVELDADARSTGKSVYQLLNERIEAMASSHPHLAELTRDLHVQPDFHGNRSPLADATLKGIMSGLTLSANKDDLALLYLATIQAVAYGTRHIIETLNEHGYGIDTLFVCGGGTKNPLFLQEHADITGCRLVLPKEPEAVLLGSAVLGAVASGQFPTITSAMRAMNQPGRIIVPNGGAITSYHEKKYRVFLQMHHDFLAYRAMMNSN